MRQNDIAHLNYHGKSRVHKVSARSMYVCSENISCCKGSLNLWGTFSSHCCFLEQNVWFVHLYHPMLLHTHSSLLTDVDNSVESQNTNIETLWFYLDIVSERCYRTHYCWWCCLRLHHNEVFLLFCHIYHGHKWWEDKSKNCQLILSVVIHFYCKTNENTHTFMYALKH